MPRTLLLADDSTTIQRVIELTFAGEDVQVVAVGDGDEAIARVEAQPPDIVLADVGMPGKNGYEVASYIKHSPQLAHIPVLLLTGAFEPVDQRKAAEAGCDGVLAKPFEPRHVIGRVKELLDRSSPGAPPSAPASSDQVHRDRPASTALDEFFERLDEAMAKLPASGRRQPGSSEPARAPTAPSAPSGSALPALQNAFAALVAEQSAPGSPPTEPPLVRPAAGDELVERVAARVLERLSDRVVRETVADLVSSIAERLVREEIERIKAAIK